MMRDMKKVRVAVARLRRLQKDIQKREKGKPNLSYEEIRSAKEEGRR